MRRGDADLSQSDEEENDSPSGDQACVTHRACVALGDFSNFSERDGPFELSKLGFRPLDVKLSLSPDRSEVLFDNLIITGIKSDDSSVIRIDRNVAVFIYPDLGLSQDRGRSTSCPDRSYENPTYRLNESHNLP